MRPETSRECKKISRNDVSCNRGAVRFDLMFTNVNGTVRKRAVEGERNARLLIPSFLRRWRCAHHLCEEEVSRDNTDPLSQFDTRTNFVHEVAHIILFSKIKIEPTSRKCFSLSDSSPVG